jgi:hypothetical protein
VPIVPGQVEKRNDLRIVDRGWKYFFSIAGGVLGNARSPRAMESVLTVARRSSAIEGGRPM